MKNLHISVLVLFFIWIFSSVQTFSQVIKTNYKIEYILNRDSILTLYRVELYNKEKKQIYMTWYDNHTEYYDYCSQTDKVIRKHLSQKRGDFCLMDFMWDEFYPLVNLQESFSVAGFTKQLSPFETFTYFILCNPNKIEDVLKRIVIVKQEDIKKVTPSGLFSNLLYSKNECILLPEML